MAQITTYDPSKARAYRELSKELVHYKEEVSARFKERQETGDLAAAQELLKEATLKTQPFIDLQRELGATGVFLAKYGVEIINEHTILFVIPKGTSRISILEEANKLVQERDGRDLIDPNYLSEWKNYPNNYPSYTQERAASKLLCIDGHVQGGDRKTRIEQEIFLGEEFTMAEIQDLAVAFSLYWVATGEPLFEWYDKQHENSFVIRGFGGTLGFFPRGLRANAFYGEIDDGVGVSALVSPK